MLPLEPVLLNQNLDFNKKKDSLLKIDIVRCDPKLKEEKKDESAEKFKQLYESLKSISLGEREKFEPVKDYLLAQFLAEDFRGKDGANKNLEDLKLFDLKGLCNDIE